MHHARASATVNTTLAPSSETGQQATRAATIEGPSLPRPRGRPDSLVPDSSPRPSPLARRCSAPLSCAAAQQQAHSAAPQSIIKEILIENEWAQRYMHQHYTHTLYNFLKTLGISDKPIFPVAPTDTLT
jgi:hypothetical protein